MSNPAAENILLRVKNGFGGSAHQILEGPIDNAYRVGVGTGETVWIVENAGQNKYVMRYYMAGNNLVLASPVAAPSAMNNVGIGTGGNPSEKLEVNGNIRASGNLQSGTNTYPDYVFEAYETGNSELNESYQFKSLAEVETFIKDNKHLPGVKSITELEKTEEGKYNVDITATSMQTLEKVEELFLHTIEQEKKIKALEAKVAKVESLEAELAALKELLLNQEK